MSLKEEKQLLQAIVNVIPVADIPELIVEKVNYNPFDKQLLFNRSLERAILLVQEILETKFELSFRVTSYSFELLFPSGKEITIPEKVFVILEKYLVNAVFTKLTDVWNNTIRFVDNDI